jgi:uncharacterized protein (DUF488 family)
MRLYTIGYAGKSAETFFRLLRDHGVNVVVDVRRRPDSQLNGFARQRDLPYLLRHLIACDYQHELEMSPTNEMLDEYRRTKSWDWYEAAFGKLLTERKLIDQLDKDWWANHAACLMCSEHDPTQCHRRIVADYMASYWTDLEIIHLR